MAWLAGVATSPFVIAAAGVVAVACVLVCPSNSTLTDDEGRRPIYRAIGPTERAVLEATGNYGSSPNASSKYFALTVEGVYQFANSEFNSGREMTITSTSVPTKVLSSGYSFNDPGGGGASVHFSEPQLPKVYSTMTPVQILPRNR